MCEGWCKESVNRFWEWRWEEEHRDVCRGW